jgi:hypothetical protein
MIGESYLLILTSTTIPLGQLYLLLNTKDEDEILWKSSRHMVKKQENLL